MNTKTIHQEITIKADPHEIYETLMDSKRHAALIGDAADISREVGGRFTAYIDYIEGANLELIPDQKIVQSWRASDWPDGHFSKITILLENVKADDGSTTPVTNLIFTQEDIPAEFCDDIAQGWHDYYWTPMKELLESK